jgi:DNA polymerase-3 subunit gamma/tau
VHFPQLVAVAQPKPEPAPADMLGGFFSAKKIAILSFMKKEMLQETTLYRKYRPHSFKDVVGQDQIVSALQASLEQKSFAHAYLFAGSRGTGKTSIARIFARELEVSAEDLYEIDAASNRGIDDVREIRDAVATLPFNSKYKVYIIDEVHMLTKEAFNALLKTLEEPPAHAIFILATTELEKLPETIVSRCQTFQFERPNHTVLTDVVKKISKKEGRNIDTDAAEVIALLGDGSFRDTLGTLQKVLISTADEKISADTVSSIVGTPKMKLVSDVVEAVLVSDIQRAISLLATAAASTTNFSLFLKLMIEKMRYVLLLRIAPELVETLKGHASSEEIAWAQALAAKAEVNVNSHKLLRLMEAEAQIGKSHIPVLPLELAIIDIIGQNS